MRWGSATANHTSWSAVYALLAAGSGLPFGRPCTKVNHMVNLQPAATTPGLDLTFGALADPTRRGIVATLAGEPRTIAALARPMPMSLVAVSKHVTVLERAGLLTRTRVGRA